jgi:hypothetical protein
MNFGEIAADLKTLTILQKHHHKKLENKNVALTL